MVFTLLYTYRVPLRFVGSILQFTSASLVINHKNAWKGVHLCVILMEKLLREEFIKEKSLDLIEIRSFMFIYVLLHIKVLYNLL